MKNIAIICLFLILAMIFTLPSVTSNNNSFEKSHLFRDVKISKVNVPDFLLLRYYTEILPLCTDDQKSYYTTTRNLENYSNFLFENTKPDYLSSYEWENYKKTREEVQKEKLKQFYFIVNNIFIENNSDYPDISNVKARAIVIKDNNPSIEDYDINSFNTEYLSCCCREIYEKNDTYCHLLGIVFTTNSDNQEIFYDGLYLYHTFILDEVYFSNNLDKSTVVLNSKYQTESIYDIFAKGDFYDNVDSLLKDSFKEYILQEIDNNDKINYQIPKDNLTYNYYILSLDYQQYMPLKCFVA